MNYTANPSLFIQRALAPATVSNIEVNEENKTAKVSLKPKEISLAIGKGGLNIKLACMITGYQIEVFREAEEDVDLQQSDVYLEEFTDEIDEWVIESLKRAGYKSARQVMAVPREILAEEADLELDTVDEVLRVFQSEFEEEDSEN